jgi:hypothetical protein
MIGLYFYWQAYSRSEGRSTNIFISSFFFLWSVMLRPFLLLIIGLFALIFLVRKRIAFKQYPRLVVAAIIPLFIIVLPWVARNYSITKKIIPFQEDIYAGYGYLPSELKARRLMTTMGEDGGTFWDPNAMASWFTVKTFRSSRFEFPAYMKRDSDFLFQVENIRNEYLNSFGSRTPSQEKLISDKLATLRSAYIDKYPIHYYLLNPLRRTVKFWGHSGSYYISAENANKAIVTTAKFIQSILYFLVLFFGTFGLVRLARKNDIGWIMLLPLIILTIMFPMIFGFMEPRYALAFYYPGMIGLTLILEPIWNRIAPNAVRNMPRWLSVVSSNV